VEYLQGGSGLSDDLASILAKRRYHAEPMLCLTEGWFVKIVILEGGIDGQFTATAGDVAKIIL